MKGHKALFTGIFWAVVILTVLLVQPTDKVLAGIPEPDAVFYGTVTVDGVLLTAESQSVISFKGKISLIGHTRMLVG